METVMINKGQQQVSLDTAILVHTPDWLRSFKGCEKYTDCEALEILKTLDVFATILLQTASENIRHIDNQQVVSLVLQNETKKIAA